MSAMSRSQARPYWHPLAAGGMLGLALLSTFLFTGHGLGSSGFFARLTAWLWDLMAPASAAANAYLGPYLNGPVLNSWITWQVIGVMLGAAASAVSSGRFRLGIEGGPSSTRSSRLFWALIGGILVGFGSRLARGCTSGVGLSGGATLAVGGFLFLICFFAAGFAVTAFSRRLWQ